MNRAKRMTSPNTARGFSLIELMIALVAGLVVSYAVVAFTMSSMKSNGEYVQSTQLTQELRNTLDLAARDLKRAGYDQNALAHMAAGTASPFSPMRIVGAATDSSCVIYGYDKVGASGTEGSVTLGGGEVRGLRRVTATVAGRTVGIVEFAASNATDGRPECDDDTAASYANYPPTCTGTWCPLSDPTRINVTRFRITNETQTAGTGGSQVRVRDLGIELRGRLAGDDGSSYLGGVSESYERTIQTSVKIRSECARTVITDCDASP